MRQRSSALVSMVGGVGLHDSGPRIRRFDARCGGRKRSTIRGLVYSRVVFQTLVPKTCWYQLSPGRSCFSICREPQLDAGHHLASQQRWCDESYHPAHPRGLPKRIRARAESRPLPTNLRIPPGDAAPQSKVRRTDRAAALRTKPLPRGSGDRHREPPRRTRRARHEPKLTVAIGPTALGSGCGGPPRRSVIIR